MIIACMPLVGCHLWRFSPAGILVQRRMLPDWRPREVNRMPCAAISQSSSVHSETQRGHNSTSIETALRRLPNDANPSPVNFVTHMQSDKRVPLRQLFANQIFRDLPLARQSACYKVVYNLHVYDSSARPDVPRIGTCRAHYRAQYSVLIGHLKL